MSKLDNYTDMMAIVLPSTIVTLIPIRGKNVTKIIHVV